MFTVKNYFDTYVLTEFNKRFLAAVAVLGIALIGCMIFFWRNKQQMEPTVIPSNTFMNQIDWSYLSGARKVQNGIMVDGLGRAVVNQDGSANQSNPPILLSGPLISVRSDFQISARIDRQSAHEATLQFYAEVPIIYDEWRYERPSVRVDFNDKFISVRLWDGSGDDPVISSDFPFAGHTDATIELHRKGSDIEVIAAGILLGKITGHDIFSSGFLWLGADAPVGENWLLRDISAAGKVSMVNVVNDPVEIPDNSLRSLVSKSRRDFSIGAALSLNQLQSDEQYRYLALGQFNMMTTENALKAQFVHPQPSVYDFMEADKLVEIATKNNMKVHAHALVFGEANPRWMTESVPSERSQIMQDHIREVAGHFAGKVAEWDVVNEPLDDDTIGLRNHIWYQAMGETYIDEAFRAAREADPNAKLYMNEFGLEQDGDRWNYFLDLVTRLKARGVPIDGVGFQSHVHEKADHIDPAVLRSHMQALAKLGLLSRVSEIDVYGTNAQVQASEYKNTLEVCLAEPSCTSYTTWGVTDKYGSTTEGHAYPIEYGDDLLWDEDFRGKPALSAIQNAIKSLAK